MKSFFGADIGRVPFAGSARVLHGRGTLAKGLYPVASSRFEQGFGKDMRFDSLRALTSGGVLNQAKGPVAVIIAKDEVEVESAVRHRADKGFRTIVPFAPTELELNAAVASEMIRMDFPTCHPTRRRPSSTPSSRYCRAPLGYTTATTLSTCSVRSPRPGLSVKC